MIFKIFVGGNCSVNFSNDDEKDFDSLLKALFFQFLFPFFDFSFFVGGDGEGGLLEILVNFKW